MGKSKKKEEKRKNAVKMDSMDDDLDVDIDSPQRKSSSRMRQKSDTSADFIADFTSPEIADTSAPMAPPRSRKTAGWSDDVAGKKSWLRRGSRPFASKDSPKKEIVLDSAAIPDIPVIPDFDDAKEEELTADISKAPSAPVSRIATFQELDSDLSKHAAFQNLDGIDLSLLTRCLLPEHLVKMEDQTPWTWDTLFADVSSHINAAMAKEQEDNSVVEKLGNTLEKIL